MSFGLSAAMFDAAYKHFTAGRIAEAEQAVRQALQADPRHVDSLHLLGVIAGCAGQPQMSLALMDQALALSPDFDSAHANRGVALMALGRREEALESLRRAVQLNPQHLHGWHGLGNALGATGDYAGAETAFRQALAINPTYYEARNHLARALEYQGRLDEAVEAYHEALRDAPEAAAIHYGLGVVLQMLGRIDEAVAAYRQALAFKPDYVTAHSNLLLALTFTPGLSGEELLAEHRAFDAQQRQGLAPAAPSWPNARDPERRLRIGYVSADFHIHPVGAYLVGPLEAHDKAGFEVFCYSNGAVEDEVTVRIAHATDNWRSIVNVPDEQVVSLIRHDQIDILVDLSGHTGGSRPLLFAHKPAPVQASWLGYPGTTGLSAMDYLVMDASTVPPGSTWTAEAVVRLPHGRFCYSPPTYMPQVASPAARPGGSVVFGSFNNLGKIGPDVVRLWARVLDAVPGSRLILKWKEIDQESVRRRLTAAFAAVGVGPDRLELRQGSRHPQMLAEYADIDIALDPFPFSGGLTSSEALWMGVPVVTLPQDRPAARQTLAFLHGIGLDDLAAQSEDDYVRIAAGLAADPARRAELRATLRPRMAAAPMNDPKVFAAGLDAAYRQMWRTWCEGKAPEEITIEG